MHQTKILSIIIYLRKFVYLRDLIVYQLCHTILDTIPRIRWTGLDDDDDDDDDDDNNNNNKAKLY